MILIPLPVIPIPIQIQFKFEFMNWMEANSEIQNFAQAWTVSIRLSVGGDTKMCK